MAENSVFSNETGQVMFGSGGNIYKVPYSFGKAFANRMGLNNYIKIDGLNLSQYCNIIQWVRCPHFTRSGLVHPFINLQTTAFDNLIINAATVNAGYLGLSKNASITNGSIYMINSLYFNSDFPQIQMCLSFIAKQNGISVGRNGTRAVTTTYSATNLDAFRSIYIGAARFSNGELMNSFARQDTLHNRLTIFNRELSVDEYLYYVSNQNGNNPQSTVGIEIDLKCDFAEILDFSVLQNGSDMRVGVRDYSDNHRHGQIMNLPAGSLEDQLAYANANLFVPFIQ